MPQDSCPLSSRLDMPAPAQFIAQCSREHKVLGRLYDDIVIAQNDSSRKQGVEKILNILTMYVKFHFHNEQTFMAVIGYPDIEHHTNIHCDFINELQTIVKNHQSGVDTFESIRSMYQRLANSHIPETDEQLVEFANNIVETCPSATCLRCKES